MAGWLDAYVLPSHHTVYGIGRTLRGHPRTEEKGRPASLQVRVPAARSLHACCPAQTVAGTDGALRAATNLCDALDLQTVWKQAMERMTCGRQGEGRAVGWAVGSWCAQHQDMPHLASRSRQVHQHYSHISTTISDCLAHACWWCRNQASLQSVGRHESTPRPPPSA